MSVLMSENAMRDMLYTHHKDDFSSLILVQNRSCIKSVDNFTISSILKARTESRIANLLHAVESMSLIGKEVRLDKITDSTTRVDLLGNSETTGMTIIELKKSKQTERESFTELLAYANHFCSIFPGLNQNAITQILVAPMESRTVRDAYAQEVILNERNILALIPDDSSGKLTFTPYYPEDSYYKWFENNLIADESMTVISISFPLINGFIDSPKDAASLPGYAKEALDTISNSIAYQLESMGYSSIVYAVQKWPEIAELFPFPNTIYVAAVNPYCSNRTTCDGQYIYGSSDDGRVTELQAIYDQLRPDAKGSWIDLMEAKFVDEIAEAVKNSFKQCMASKHGSTSIEFGFPSWAELKVSMLDSVTVFHANSYLTGVLRKIYLQYMTDCYSKGGESRFYGDDMPMYLYQTLETTLPAWEILKELGLIGNEEN